MCSALLKAYLLASLLFMPLAVRIAIKPGWSERIGFPEMLIPLRAGNGQGRGGIDDAGAGP